MIQLNEITKSYNSRDGQVNALDSVNFNFQAGEFIVVRGPSGSGKTTLLLTLGGMLHPTSGSLLVDEKNVYNLGVSERSQFRANHIGFVFQMFHLIPYLTVIENVLTANPSNVPKEEVIELLTRVGLQYRIHHTPAQLSAGEKQRTAIARALVKHPKFILADEPTGNLDPENAHGVLQLLSEYKMQGGTVIIVTHGSDADQYADRIIYVRNGKLETE
jgi:putative ABC transport system ATP-binding protein